MPVTARLSQAFYDRFGEQVTNELVEWFNAVDLTYRNDLREINHTNFTRFEAVLEARFARTDLQLERRLGEFETRVEQRLSDFESRFEQKFREQSRDVTLFREQMERSLLQHLRWMIGLWMTTTIGIFAVFAAILRQG